MVLQNPLFVNHYILTNRLVIVRLMEKDTRLRLTVRQHRVKIRLPVNTSVPVGALTMRSIRDSYGKGFSKHARS